MTATLTDDVNAPAPGGLRYGRIVIGAILLEVVLFAVLVPFGMVVGAQAVGGPGGGSRDTAFFAAVAIGCLAFGYLAGRLVVRGVASRRVVHGFLTGLVATAIYLAVCTFSAAGLAAAIAAYGPLLFWSNNLLRIVGTTAGAAHARRS